MDACHCSAGTHAGKKPKPLVGITMNRLLVPAPLAVQRRGGRRIGTPCMNWCRPAVRVVPPAGDVL